VGIYKLAPPLRFRYELALSLALVALGLAYLKRLRGDRP
jgi:hypothetical protein